MKKDILKGLTEEQVEKASKCETSEELLALAKEEGIELSLEQLTAVSGGACSDDGSFKIKRKCPHCEREYEGAKIYDKSGSGDIYSFYCPECNHCWREEIYY